MKTKDSFFFLDHTDRANASTKDDGKAEIEERENLKPMADLPLSTGIDSLRRVPFLCQKKRGRLARANKSISYGFVPWD